MEEKLGIGAVRCDSPEMEDCEFCKGKGEIISLDQSDYIHERCEFCKGTGKAKKGYKWDFNTDQWRKV